MSQECRAQGQSVMEALSKYSLHVHAILDPKDLYKSLGVALMIHYTLHIEVTARDAPFRRARSTDFGTAAPPATSRGPHTSAHRGPAIRCARLQPQVVGRHAQPQ